MRRFRACAAFAVTIALLAWPAAALASRSQLVTFEAPPELLQSGDAVRVATLNELQSLGVTALRMTVWWQSVAPSPDARRRPSFDATDPSAYAWGSFGQLADEAHARGLKLLIAASGPVPRWASAGGRDHLTDPSAADYLQFMTALARRFGAEATAISVWNEPNLVKFLAPQFGPHGSLVSPSLYRALFFAGDNGLRAGGYRGPVLAGEMEPVGNSIAVAPLRFLRGVLCLDSAYQPVRRCSELPAGGWSVHPYMRPAPPTTAPPGPDDVTIGGLSRLVAALDRAAAAGMVRRRLPVYATEFGVQSYPNRVAGVPLALQSDYRSIAEFLAWSNPRVVSFSQYLLTDPAPVPGPASSRYVFQMGLYLSAGHVPKPAYRGFELPLVARRGPGAVALWGLVRPARADGASGAVTVQYRDRASAWRPATTARYGPSGYWTAHVAIVRGARGGSSGAIRRAPSRSADPRPRHTRSDRPRRSGRAP
jgi:hypothetical protein